MKHLKKEFDILGNTLSGGDQMRRLRALLHQHPVRLAQHKDWKQGRTVSLALSKDNRILLSALLKVTLLTLSMFFVEYINSLFYGGLRAKQFLDSAQCRCKFPTSGNSRKLHTRCRFYTSFFCRSKQMRYNVLINEPQRCWLVDFVLFRQSQATPPCFQSVCYAKLA